LSRTEKKAQRETLKKWNTNPHKLAKNVTGNTVMATGVVGAIDIVATGGTLNAGAYIGAWIGYNGTEIYHHFKPKTYTNLAGQQYQCTPKVEVALQNMTRSLRNAFNKHNDYKFSANDEKKFNQTLIEVSCDLEILAPLVQISKSSANRTNTKTFLFCLESPQKTKHSDLITHQNVFNKLAERQTEIAKTKQDKLSNPNKNNARKPPKKLGR